MTAVVVVYMTGVLVGLLGSDAPPLTRVWLATLWPIGMAAFVVTVTILLAASLVAFPVIGVTVAALAAIAWLLLT